MASGLGLGLDLGLDLDLGLGLARSSLVSGLGAAREWV